MFFCFFFFFGGGGGGGGRGFLSNSSLLGADKGSHALEKLNLHTYFLSLGFGVRERIYSWGSETLNPTRRFMGTYTWGYKHPK